MKKWLLYSTAWVAICGVLGWIGVQFIGVSFWWGFCIAAATLLLNGVVAEIEDRSPGGLLSQIKKRKTAFPEKENKQDDEHRGQ